MKLFSMTENDMTEYANNAVDNFLSGLENEKIITTEQFNEYSKYRLALVPPTMWGRLWAMVTPDLTDARLRYYLVKPVGTYRIKIAE